MKIGMVREVEIRIMEIPFILLQMGLSPPQEIMVRAGEISSRLSIIYMGYLMQNMRSLSLSMHI